MSSKVPICLTFCRGVNFLSVLFSIGFLQVPFTQSCVDSVNLFVLDLEITDIPSTISFVLCANVVAIVMVCIVSIWEALPPSPPKEKGTIALLIQLQKAFNQNVLEITVIYRFIAITGVCFIHAMTQLQVFDGCVYSIMMPYCSSMLPIIYMETFCTINFPR